MAASSTTVRCTTPQQRSKSLRFGNGGGVISHISSAFNRGIFFSFLLALNPLLIYENDA